MHYCTALLLFCLPLPAVEKAAYDSNGRIIALLSDAEDVDVVSNVVAVLPSGKRVPLQLRREGRGAMRQGRSLAWSVQFTLPDGGRGRLDLKSEEDASGVRYASNVTAETPLAVDAIEFVLDLPRTVFAGGRVSAGDAAPIALARVRAGGPVLYSGDTSALHFGEAAGNIALDVGFEKPHRAAIVDRWDNFGRSFQLRAAILRGPVSGGASGGITASLRLTNRPPAPAPVRLALDTSKPRYRFDGFGGNYCWSNQSPISAYTLKNLKLAWARTEMKVQQWDRQRGDPGPEIRADLETMRSFQQMGVPYVISIWWLPERFYTDPYEKPRSAHFRLIKPEKWDELLDLLGSYLLYAKREYSVEPDLFSFNESNIGVYVGLTPETHAEAVKRIGAHFRMLGLKTKMLLGDATGPRDTHKFVLEAAADPEALQFVGAVAFHSWGGGTPEQYSAWGDVAEWLNLPLLVTELGVDAAAYYTRSWDSYHYGLREAQMTQELLTYARPQGTQFWQFTNDYGLARLGEGGAVEPTSRFWLMKHFTDLTPQKSEALTTFSDQRSVLYTAFRKDDVYTLHILNLGGVRPADLQGLPVAEWQVTETTEAAQYQQKSGIRSSGAAALRLDLPARSLVTLAAKASAVAGAAQQQAAKKPIGYRSKITVYDLTSRSTRTVYQADQVIEAPNWSRDGRFLLVNTGGNLYRLPVNGAGEAKLEKIELGGSYRCNNDHDFSRDGRMLAFSASGASSRQSQVYLARADGSDVKLMTPASPSYFHGWSPDGKWLAFVGQRANKFELYRVAVTGGSEQRLTSKGAYDDGPDYSPDGKWIYFNSNRSGGWDIWRMPAEGAGPGDAKAEQITSDELEDWFPHLSPDGKRMVFLSFPKGTSGHNDRMDGVALRMMPAPDKKLKPARIEVVVTFFGGQGSINVNSWSPDSKKFAYVVYEPLSAR